MADLSSPDVGRMARRLLADPSIGERSTRFQSRFSICESTAAKPVVAPPRHWLERCLISEQLEFAQGLGDVHGDPSFASIAGLCAMVGLDACGQRARSVVRVGDLSRMGPRVFLKLYTGRGHGFLGMFRSSKARREATNLNFLRALGISTPRIIATGTRAWRLGLRMDREVIVTEAVPHTLSLDHYWALLPRGDRRRRRLIEILAVQVSRMHAARFYHRDLKWRNLLVKAEPSGEPSFCWIDCPSGRTLRLGWRRERARLKDLATLAKLAVTHCTLTEQMRFLRMYAGGPAAGRRRLALEVARYFHARWKD